MEPFITFMDEDVLNDYPPSSWEKITSSWHSGAAEEVQESIWKGGDSQNRRVCPWGHFPTTPFLGCTNPLIIPTMKQPARRAKAPSIFTEKAQMPPGSPVTQKRMPLPGFEDITQSLIRDQPPQETIKVPWELTSPGLLVAPTMTMLMCTRIHQDEATSVMYLVTVTASQGLVSLGIPLVVVDHQMPTLLITDTDVVHVHPK